LVPKTGEVQIYVKQHVFLQMPTNNELKEQVQFFKWKFKKNYFGIYEEWEGQADILLVNQTLTES